MRLFLGAAVVLLLAACASQGTTASKDQTAASASASTAAATAQASFLSKNAAASETIDLDKQSVSDLATNDANLWARIRRGFQIPDLNDDYVAQQQQWYVDRPDYVNRMTDRSKKYLYHIVEQLEARHMPTELALLPFVESAFNPQALSVAKAAGMWQFVPGTGRTFKLRQNMFRDERRDVLASTSAALDYLSKLHDMFGDWYLALAAYNWGEGNVQRAIEHNEALGLPTDYESLNLPSETRNYVPKLQAVKNIIANPAQYGLTLPDIPNHPYFLTVTTSRDIDVSVAAQLAGMSLDDFKALNPSFSKPVILGATDPQILLPFENASTFEHNLKSYQGQLSSWTTYTVDQRETPASIADKLGVDLDTVMAVNHIPKGMRLKSGSTILVPRTDADDEDISADVADNAVLAMEPDVPDTRKMLIRIRRRQAMDVVAARYGVSTSQIDAWNHKHRSFAMPGQLLVLHVPVGRAMPAEPGPVQIATNVSGGHIMRADYETHGTMVTTTVLHCVKHKKCTRVKVEREVAPANDNVVAGNSHGKHARGERSAHADRTAQADTRDYADNSDNSGRASRSGHAVRGEQSDLRPVHAERVSAHEGGSHASGEHAERSSTERSTEHAKSGSTHKKKK